MKKRRETGDDQMSFLDPPSPLSIFLRHETQGAEKKKRRGPPRVRASNFAKWGIQWQAVAQIKGIQVGGRRDPDVVRLDNTLKARRAKANQTRVFRMTVETGSTLRMSHGDVDTTATKSSPDQNRDGLQRMVSIVRGILKHS